MRPILTAAQMRSAEQAAIDAGTPVDLLMERAGSALAEAAVRFAGELPTLILCGPGNNGGDGYVAARHLADRGIPVRVAAMAEPVTDVAKWAKGGWSGEIGTLQDCQPAPLLIDCLFGTGLKRGLKPSVSTRLCELAQAARWVIACDLPSGVASDDGQLLSEVPQCAMTVTFGALKPAHRLMPAMARSGRVVLADIGLAAPSQWQEIGRPYLPPLDPTGHKYNRGLVVAVGGDMPGAIALAATAAARAGAGYVRLCAGTHLDAVPASVVQGQASSFADPRVGAILIGPGLGGATELLEEVLNSGRPLVIDADALAAVGSVEQILSVDAILTPHEGEFERLFGRLPGPKPERALAAAASSGSVVVLKGPDTLVASPDGQVAFAPPAPSWLATAGTGDVLAGMIAAQGPIGDLTARIGDGSPLGPVGQWSPALISTD